MFQWDEDNIRHIAEHEVIPEEAEQVLANAPTDAVLQIHEGEERHHQFGLTDAGRCLVVVTTWRSESVLRVVTAYPASPALRRAYFRRRGV